MLLQTTFLRVPLGFASYGKITLQMIGQLQGVKVTRYKEVFQSDLKVREDDLKFAQESDFICLIAD